MITIKDRFFSLETGGGKDICLTSAPARGSFGAIPGVIYLSGASCRTLGHELRHPKQVVGGSDKPCLKLRPVTPLEPCLSEASDRLHPAEYSLDPFSYAPASLSRQKRYAQRRAA